MGAPKLLTEEIENSFPNEQVMLQVERILRHKHFSNSPILTRFLLFIISETLRDRKQQIKEYSIAVEVFNRPPEFNPHDDAIVRIHAGRLRRALTDYYTINGINDPILIYIPKGSYIPQFERFVPVKSRKPALYDLHGSAQKTVVAVFPLRVVSDAAETKMFATILCEQLSAELAKAEDRSVIGYYSIEMIAKIGDNFLEAAKALGAEHFVSGHILDNRQQKRVFMNWANASNGEIMISKSFNVNIEAPGIVDAHDEIIKTFVAAMKA